MMDVRPIRTDADLDWALAEVEPYFDNPPEQGTPEADRYDVLTALITAYEDEHYPIEEADPVAMLRFAIEDMGRSREELGELLGSREVADDILARRRRLTVGMVHAIATAWHLPAETLVRPYDLVPAEAA